MSEATQQPTITPPLRDFVHKVKVRASFLMKSGKTLQWSATYPSGKEANEFLSIALKAGADSRISSNCYPYALSVDMREVAGVTVEVIPSIKEPVNA